MKVAVNLQAWKMMHSLVDVGGIVGSILGGERTTLFPDAYRCGTPAVRDAIASRMLDESDVIVSPPDAWLLRVRASKPRNTPIVHVLLGSMSRGGQNVSVAAADIRTTDTLLTTSTADARIAALFFENATIATVGLPYKDAVFGTLMTIERDRLRQTLGFGPGTKLVVYAGRLTLEKNVHTLLRTFRVVKDAVPEAHLILAGPAQDVPFGEFGLQPIAIRSMLARVGLEMSLQDSVQFWGAVSARELHGLYNIADVVVNMSLHHDENFGLTQVEAMACGTPVVATHWGGLKDTVVDGVTGYSVSTVLTSSGVKADWWEAANQIVAVLQSDATRAKLSRQCLESVRAYRECAQRDAWLRVVSDCAATSDRPWAPVAVTRFAREYWAECAPSFTGQPQYRGGTRSLQLYATLIAPYCGLSPRGVPLHASSEPTHIVTLAAPVELTGRVIAVNDPIFPFEIAVPGSIRGAVCIAVRAMAERPVATISSLEAVLEGQPDADAVIRWLIDTGVLLRSHASTWEIAPQSVRAHVGRPLLAFARTSAAADVLIRH